MNIFVCVKQVMARDSVLRPNETGTWAVDDGVSFEMNEPDTFALEEALRLKERHGGEVVAITAGPARSASTLREALAKGADRAIHVEGNRYVESDAYATAQALAAAIRREPHDLVLTGLQSDDAGFGQTGVILAELLQLPHATIIMEIDASGGQLRCKRELEAGWFQTITLPRACAAHDPERHQQGEVRHADGHQARPEEAFPEVFAGRARDRQAGAPESPVPLPAPAIQADRVPGGKQPGSR